MGGGDPVVGGIGGAVEKWSMFTPRPLVHKSTSDLGSDPAAAGKGHRLIVRLIVKILTKCFKAGFL